MTLSPPHRRRLTAAAFALLTATLVPGLTQLPAVAGAPAAPNSSPSASSPSAADEVITLGDTVPGLSDLDARGTVRPTASIRSAAAQLGAVDLRFNQFGTPTSILPADGVLAPASSTDAAVAARDWLRGNAAVFGLTAGQVDGLELVNAQKLAQSDARAVLFRQRFGDLTSALDGMVTVGVANGEIAHASSSIVPTDTTPPAAELSPAEAWVKAAANVGREVGLSEIGDAVESRGWTRFSVPDFAQEQQVRLRALPMADGVVRPVFETNVVDSESGAALAYTLMVDAVTGEILHRQNLVEHSNDFVPFQGSVDGTECGEPHEFELTDGATQEIVVVATAANAANDIVIKLFKGDEELASGDLLTSPETLTYAPGGTIPQGVYNVRICPFDGIAFLPPTNYGGTITTSDESGEAPQAPLPAWRYFPANPALNWSPDHTPRNSVIGCWKIRGRDDCTLSSGPLEQPFSAAWDVSQSTSTSTLTTTGNNAETREAWVSPLTPGGSSQAPVSPTREYFDEFTDAWNNSLCDPANLTPTGNDILPAVTNLFVGHNRMHDYSYGLGFTELNYNMQRDNLGRNPDPTRANDPEIGNVQAGAIGGLQSGLGRNNANQITQQDGTPGITNQYLFQPVAGAFYAPCADGSFDGSIYGHEYTHAITNRMIAGPDQGIGSDQGGAMGESWGDLVAGEYLFSHGYPNGGNPWAVGPYATGNKQTGIRNYAINKNPLNYSNVGYDSPGPQVHADGEIWNGTMWQVRQSLVNKYQAKFPYGWKARQLRCAEGSSTQGPLKSTECPGNRRWVTLMFDSFLLQQGATSMLDARDAMLAADKMRYNRPRNKHGQNYKAIWDAFAKRGMGKGARTATADAHNPTPSFVSPKSKSASVTFRTPTPGQVFVGMYEARSNAVADTVKKSKMDATVKLVPGTYKLLFASRKNGHKRFNLTVKAGQERTVKVRQPKNLAARANGAKVIATSVDSRNEGSLIDGTEDTNWGGVNEDGTNVDETSPFVAVDLAGKKAKRISRVNVSALLNPPPVAETEIPFVANPDEGSRFTALRKFALEACVKKCASDGATWKRFFVSKDNAFPAKRPRPLSPNLALRSFNVPNVKAAAIRLVALENQCTGFKGYAGDQDNDPSNNTDCKTGSDRGSIVHAAELQVF